MGRRLPLEPAAGHVPALAVAADRAERAGGAGSGRDHGRTSRRHGQRRRCDRAGLAPARARTAVGRGTGGKGLSQAALHHGAGRPDQGPRPVGAALRCAGSWRAGQPCRRDRPVPPDRHPGDGTRRYAGPAASGAGRGLPRRARRTLSVSTCRRRQDATPFPAFRRIARRLKPHAAAMHPARVGINPNEKLFSNTYHVKKIKHCDGSG
ncbi:conserved hypothetical protein [Cupriavidus taiwanensis]|uniref:Uncharacterized protein n=1 Tax=Cupriavidus taiwanensis TaxID=164546 RepID=A0A375E6F2_9BURK|nr:conserved hypothetical protein [Cupriavidus taiwanensis]SOZ62518.1 conserved hypothetical protein [Cupriavidus taiwanensis]